MRCNIDENFYLSLKTEIPLETMSDKIYEYDILQIFELIKIFVHQL